MTATLKTTTANGIHMRYAEAGSGPLVLFCHGWPELSLSWRHQLPAFAALGYDGVKLMADAINRAGSTDGAAIRDALQATQGFRGATGEISYPEGSRIPQKSVAIVEIVDEQQTLVEVVVPQRVVDEES